MKTHYLKSWPSNFKNVARGVKTFEIRKNDRDFQVGDQISFMEYDPDLDHCTGKDLPARITYIESGQWAWPLHKLGMAAFGIELIEALKEEDAKA